MRRECRNPRISIIIPVYNVERYVERCLLSVVNQSYKNLECIIVDDCSPDNSMQIVKSFMEKYMLKENFKIVIHITNKGLSAARNSGIRKATGDYVFFLDSDDELPQNSIGDLVSCLKGKEIDFIIGNYMILGEKSVCKCTKLQAGVYRGNRFILENYLKENWNVMGCNKLINLSFLQEKNLFFVDNLLHEDELWSFMLACKSSSIAICSEYTYLYYIHEESITGRNLNVRIQSLIMILKQMNIYVDTQYIENRQYAKLVVDKFQKELMLKAINSNLLVDLQLQIYTLIRNDFYCNTKQLLKTIIYGFNILLPFNLGFCYYKWLLLLLNKPRA